LLNLLFFANEFSILRSTERLLLQRPERRPGRRDRLPAGRRRPGQRVAGQQDHGCGHSRQAHRDPPALRQAPPRQGQGGQGRQTGQVGQTGQAQDQEDHPQEGAGRQDPHQVGAERGRLRAALLRGGGRRRNRVRLHAALLHHAARRQGNALHGHHRQPQHAHRVLQGSRREVPEYEVNFVIRHVCALNVAAGVLVGRAM
jgi:hypothetical protein